MSQVQCCPRQVKVLGQQVTSPVGPAAGLTMHLQEDVQ